MTKLKTFAVLFLAVMLCVFSANALVKTQQLAEKGTVTSDAAIQKSIVAEKSNALVEVNASKSIRLHEVNNDARKVSNSRRPTSQKLDDNVVSCVKNPDGTITMGFRSVSSKGTAVSQNDAAYIATLFENNISGGPYVPSIGHENATYGDLCAFGYFDLSLIPDVAVITDANVDISIIDVGTYPTGSLLFNINDLFADLATATNQDIYDDLRNTSGGNTYAAETVGRAVAGTENYTLSAQALTDIGTAITGDTLFGMGFDPQVTTEMIWSIGSEFGSGTDPVLYVTFTAPGANPVITNVTATPSSEDNIGLGTITFEATWTDADDHAIDDFGMIFQYRTPWGEDVQLSGGLWEKTGTGTYSWTGEWDPDQDHQVGAHDVSFLIYDGTFTDTFDFTAGDDLFTITSPSVEYADFNDDGPLGQWPAGWVDSPTTDPGPPALGWQYDYIWTGTTDHIAYAFNSEAAQDCTLTSPVVNLSAAATAHVFFNCLWEGTPTSFTIEGSLDGFSTVEDSVELTTAIDADSWESLNWDITSWAAGQSTVWIRFHFVAPLEGSGTPAEPYAGAIFDIVQIVAGDAAITVTNTDVTPATSAVIDGDPVAFSVDWTGSTTATVDDWIVDLYVQSDAGLGQALITGLYNDDIYGTVVTQNAPGDFTATVSDLVFRPGIEIGAYDLMGYATDTIDWAYGDFANNEDELTLTTPSFWYQDFNDDAGALPTGWSALSLPGGEDGDDWMVTNYTGTTDYFPIVMYDQTVPADPQAEELRSEVIDCSTMEGCTLYYAYEWASGFDPTATGEVRISNDGGSSFTTLYTHTAPASGSIETGVMEINLTNYADGEDDVVLSFRYNATDDYYWAVQIVQIDEKPILPLPATGPIGLGLLLAAIGGLIIRKRK